MTIAQLIEMLTIAEANDGTVLLAATAHGTYYFDVVDVEVGLNTGITTLRLSTIDDEEEDEE